MTPEEQLKSAQQMARENNLMDPIKDPSIVNLAQVVTEAFGSQMDALNQDRLRYASIVCIYESFIGAHMEMGTDNALQFLEEGMRILNGGYPMIAPCTCQNEFQDRLYGRGNRVFNPRLNKEKACCTVCGTEKGIKSDEKSKKT